MSTVLPLAVAIEFAYALWDDVAAQLGVRYLAIKGIGAQIQGIQPTRVPGDIDVLVAPKDFAASCAALESRGWRERPADMDQSVFPRHSSSFYHESWPCDIDLHFRFPGMEADASAVFEVLLRDQSNFIQCGHSIACPSSDAALTIAALHYLRGLWVARHRSEYEFLLQVARHRHRDELIGLGRELGALACARPFYETVFGLSGANWGRASREWELRTRFETPNSRRIAILLSGTWKQKALMLSTALFPDRETLLKTDITRELHGFDLVHAYLSRWRRGVVSIIPALREAVVIRGKAE